MNQDELDRLNDRTLERNERLWLEPDDDEDYSEDEGCEADNWAEDEMMDERDGF